MSTTHLKFGEPLPMSGDIEVFLLRTGDRIGVIKPHEIRPELAFHTSKTLSSVLCAQCLREIASMCDGTSVA